MVSNYGELYSIFDSWYRFQLELKNKFYATKDHAYNKNYIYSLLQDSDPQLLNEVYPFIRSIKSELKEKMVYLYKVRLNEDISKYIKMVGIDMFNKALSEQFNKRLLHTYEEIIDEINHTNQVCGYKNSNEEFIITKMLYEQYISTEHGRFDKKNINRLEEFLSIHGIYLSKFDSQYTKYGLFTISDEFDLVNVQYTPMLYHTKVESFIRFDEISRHLFHKLIELKNKGEIISLALRPDYHFAEDKLGLSYLTEEVERGITFSLKNFGRDSITKLYSKNYDNQLWINIDNKNITFEEFLDNFIVYKESIVTQVIHAEYTVTNGGIYITHIDHEFIFYTLEEYEKRKSNPNQKGEARTRFKTFKIDNSKIPVTDAHGNNFFLFVLEEYFINKDLIQEYFDIIADTSA